MTRRLTVAEHRAEIARLKAMAVDMGPEPRSAGRRPVTAGDDVRRAARRTLPGRLHSLRQALRRRRMDAVTEIESVALAEGDAAILETAFEFMSCEQVAHRLGVTVRSVRAWIRRGVLVAERHGRAWHVDPVSVARLERVARGED